MAENKTVTWTASEFIEHERGVGWYALLLLGTAGLAALIWFITKDYFATAVIVILGVLVASVAHHKPEAKQYELSDRGFKAGEKFYTYNEFKSFSIVRDGALNSLLFTPIKRFVPPPSVFFEDEDEEAIVEALADHLPMEEMNPDRIDRLTRKLRF